MDNGPTTKLLQNAMVHGRVVQGALGSFPRLMRQIKLVTIIFMQIPRKITLQNFSKVKIFPNVFTSHHIFFHGMKPLANWKM